MIRVTEAIKIAGLMGDSANFFTPEGAARGTAVHAACEFDDDGDLDDDALDPSLSGYVESWRAFRGETGLEIIGNELEVNHEPLGYVGHLDRLVKWNDKVHVLDIKTGSDQRWHAIQLAAYAMAWASETGSPTPLRGSVQLYADGRPGTYRAAKSRKDFDVWKAALTVARWKQGETR